MKFLPVDIETRAPSQYMVTDVGLYAHAPHAKMLGMRYQLPGDDEVLEWRGYFADGENADCSDAPPEDFIETAQRDDVLLLAHNAGYERVVGRDSVHIPWWPDLPPEKFVCSAAWAATFNLPRSLGALSKLLLPPEQAKLVDVAEGVKYMWDESRPLLSATDMDKQMEYCGGDVTAMVGIMKHLPPVDPRFLEEYHASEHINDRGVMIDTDLAEAVVAMKPQIDADLLRDLDRATGGGVKLRGPSLLRWLEDQLPEEMHELLIVGKKVRKGYGFRTEKRKSAGKEARAQILDAMEEGTNLTHVRDALQAFDEANKAAVTKFASAMKRVNDDGVIRGQFMFRGASQTGRFSASGMQVHNLKRDVHPDAVRIIEAAKKHYARPGVLVDMFGETVNALASGVLRPTFIAPEGGMLAWGDWSSIEARMLPWLSGDPRAEPTLDIFRNDGDVYVVEAGNIYGRTITKDEPERQIGKVAVLSLGYQGAVGAFQSMAKNYGVQVGDSEARKIVDRWRAANPWAVDFWHAVERAAMQAIGKPTEMLQAGRLRYQFLPGLLDGTLLCWLPSGNWIAYPQARIRDVEKYDGEVIEPALTFHHPVYGPSATYGGALVENATQAECASILREKLVACEEAGLEAVLHVHDEIVIEADAEDIDRSAALLEKVMNTVPTWCDTFPLAAEVEIGPRYKVKAN